MNPDFREPPKPVWTSSELRALREVGLRYGPASWRSEQQLLAEAVEAEAAQRLRRLSNPVELMLVK